MGNRTSSFPVPPCCSQNSKLSHRQLVKPGCAARSTGHRTGAHGHSRAKHSTQGATQTMVPLPQFHSLAPPCTTEDECVLGKSLGQGFRFCDSAILVPRALFPEPSPPCPFRLGTLQDSSPSPCTKFSPARP